MNADLKCVEQDFTVGVPVVCFLTLKAERERELMAACRAHQFLLI